jgi:hypothetical protein
MKLDFIIPASPNDAFFSQLAMFRLSLDMLGGPYRDARLVAVLGDDVRSPLPERWQPHFERIEIVWAEPHVFQRIGYRAQGDHRFEAIRPEADLVVLCDADTLLLRMFAQEVFELAQRDAIGGVIAHYHFPWGDTSGEAHADWNNIARQVIGTGIDTPYHYTLLDQDAPGSCPFYINLGLLIGSPRSLHALNDSCKAIRVSVRNILNNYFDAQVTLALAVAQRSLRATALPMRYNFPNDPIADRKYASELDEICLIHYLRTERFDRHKIFAENEAFEAFLELDLSGSERLFQKFVIDLTGGKYPFAPR